jgi:hypothetical protein
VCGSRPPPGRSAARTDTALPAHERQKAWLDQTQGMDSYVQTMEELCREVGKMSGRFEFAEGWRKHLHAGFCAPDADPLRAALGGHGFSEPN